MSHELYFLPLLMKAFDEPDRKQALLQAFEEIRTLGGRPGYQDGYVQFQEFMRCSEESAIETLLTDWEEAPLRLPAMETFPDLILHMNGRTVGTIYLSPTGASSSFAPILPGLCQLRLSTGWVIWEERLNDKDLLWTSAFPGQPLLMAAETVESQTPISREFHPLDGALTITVHPGLEAGILRVQFTSGKQGSS
ncbi:MAG: hypothetical protein GC154_16880 [bacterium]|nr:hypothetical protein [bacterium]